MYVDNNLFNFKALIRKKTNSFISRLTVPDNAIIKALLDNMVAREKTWILVEHFVLNCHISTVVSICTVIYLFYSCIFYISLYTCTQGRI